MFEFEFKTEFEFCGQKEKKNVNELQKYCMIF